MGPAERRSQTHASPVRGVVRERRAVRRSEVERAVGPRFVVPRVSPSATRAHVSRRRISEAYGPDFRLSHLV